MGDTRQIAIPIGDAETVTGILEGGTGTAPGILLAHGAGAGQHHRWMVFMRGALAAQGFPTMTFDYRYTARGRKAPDRLPTLLDVHEAAADTLSEMVDEVVLAGKSMGGRVASHLAADRRWPASALVYYGYPLVPVGKPEPRDTTHLARISSPQLFFAGTRDRLGPPDLVREVVTGLPDACLVVVDDADHSFAVPKRTGRTQAEVLTEIAARTAEFVRSR